MRGAEEAAQGGVESRGVMDQKSAGREAQQAEAGGHHVGPRERGGRRARLLRVRRGSLDGAAARVG